MRTWQVNVTIPRLDGALCAHDDPDAWFPGRHSTKADVEAVKAVCDACPARRGCLEWAMETHEPEGIWGGLDEDERRRLRRARNEQRRRDRAREEAS